jgi:hypothetical protein
MDWKGDYWYGKKYDGIEWGRNGKRRILKDKKCYK